MQTRVSEDDYPQEARAAARDDRVSLAPVPRPGRWWSLLPVVLFLVLALWRLGGYSFWLDEVMSADFADDGPRAVIANLALDVHPPLYFLAVSLSIRLLGMSELAARLPGVLFGAAAVAALILLARRHTGYRAALLAGLLLATSPIFIEYGREVHPFSAAALLAVLGWWSLLELLRRPTWPRALAYGLACATLMYTFYLAAALIITSQVVLAAALRPTGRRLGFILGAWALALMLFAPWVPHLIGQVRHSDQQYIIASYFPEGVQLYHVRDALAQVALGLATANWPAGLKWCLLAGVAALGLGLGTWLWPTLRPPSRRALLLGAATAFLPLLIFLGFCQLQPILVARYLVPAVPMMALFYGLLLSLAPQRLGTAGAAVLVLAGLACHVAALRHFPREDWRGAARYLTRSMGPLDAVVCDSPTAHGLLVQYLHWLGRDDLAGNVFPPSVFLKQTRGGFYPFTERRLFVVQRPLAESIRFAESLKLRNRPLGTLPLEAGFQVLVLSGARPPASR